MRALWLADVLRGAGLNVVEQPGWQTKGKELDAIEGLVCHHTASPPTSTLATNLYVVTNGNAVAPGPIAQVMLWRNGTFYVIASGKANHAGAGGPWGWLPKSPPGQLSVANARTIGIEAVNSGVGEPWSAEMVAAYEIGAAAILRHIGVGVDRMLTHHEWAPTRKIDPAGPTGGRVATLPGSQTWDGNAWRALVGRWLQPGPPDPPPVDIPPAFEEDSPMLIVGRDANHADPRRWLWDGISVHLLESEDEFNRTRMLFRLHPSFNTLAAPFWMNDEELTRFGGKP